MIELAPILDELEIWLLDDLNGLKWLVILLKSLNGSSLTNKALPSGQSTILLIRMTEAFEFNALS